MTSDLTYKYRGARALVIMHEHYLREFIKTWREFHATEVPLPETLDPSYTSPQALLRHVLRAARGYMVWMCAQLELPDPGIRSTPEDSQIEAEADAYLDHVVDQWRLPLANVAPERFEEKTYTSRWGVDYCIDAMLEHAVMHPLRHTFQLRELMKQG